MGTLAVRAAPARARMQRRRSAVRVLPIGIVAEPQCVSVPPVGQQVESVSLQTGRVTVL